MTPLYDAVGRGIGVLDGAMAGKDAAKAIMVVMTHGMENDSSSTTPKSPSWSRRARMQVGSSSSSAKDLMSPSSEAMGAAKASVAAYSGGKGLRAARDVAARIAARYALTSGDVRQARDKAAFTPKERNELAGKK